MQGAGFVDGTGFAGRPGERAAGRTGALERGTGALAGAGRGGDAEASGTSAIAALTGVTGATGEVSTLERGAS